MTTYKNTGEVTCIKCEETYRETKMMDVDAEGNTSLIFCEKCDSWMKWK